MKTQPSVLIDRRAVTFGLLLAASPAVGAPSPCPATRVLFVCPAGTVKSAIAREFLRKRAAERNVAVEVQSRAIHTEDHVSPALAVQLRADGIDPRSDIARDLQPDDVAKADLIVAFDDATNAPALVKAEAWDIPSWNDQYAKAKAALTPKIDALIDRIESERCR